VEKKALLIIVLAPCRVAELCILLFAASKLIRIQSNCKILHTANCVHHHSHHIRIYIAHHHMNKMSYTMQHVYTKPNQHTHTKLFHSQNTCKTHTHTHTHTLFQTCMQNSDPSYIHLLFYALILIFSWCNSVSAPSGIHNRAIMWTPGSMHEY